LLDKKKKKRGGGGKNGGGGRKEKAYLRIFSKREKRRNPIKRGREGGGVAGSLLGGRLKE